MRISDWSSDVCSSDLLSVMPTMQAFPDLLVGIETGDDAAVYRINDEQAIVATTDFFMPIVDDARDFGRIAAANALSSDEHTSELPSLLPNSYAVFRLININRTHHHHNTLSSPS